MEYQIVNEKVRIEHDGNGVFRYIYLRNADIDLDTAKVVVDKGDEMGAHLPACVNIVDVRDMLFMSSAARKYFAAQKRNNLAANSVVIHSVLQRSIANLYMKFTKQLTPTRVFTDIEEAEAWANEKFRALKDAMLV